MKLPAFVFIWMVGAFAVVEAQSGSTSSTPFPHATIRGNTIRLMPSNFTFKIPTDWVQWNKENSRSLHLSRREIRKVERLKGEWDEPFSEIVNSIFPIEQCAAHAGGLGDLQVRTYVANKWSVPQVEAAIEKAGIAAASKFSKKVSLSHETVEQWHVTKLSYELDYGDYFGTAHIDFYTRTLGKQTVALLFRYTGNRRSNQKQITQILNSFRAGK
jgi:hypothetical protein